MQEERVSNGSGGSLPTAFQRERDKEVFEKHSTVSQPFA
jgi:hypothetical protein